MLHPSKKVEASFPSLDCDLGLTTNQENIVEIIVYDFEVMGDIATDPLGKQ